MRVAVVGYGKMGHEVDVVLHERGHTSAPIDLGEDFPEGCAVGIDFTQPDAVRANVARAMKSGTHYVIGTTGWSDEIAEVRRVVEESGGGAVYSANFSLGVNLFYRIVSSAAGVFSRVPEYDPYVFERHHRQKKDAPSGTAKVLAGILESASPTGRKALSNLAGALPANSFHVAALRAGGIVGDHVVGFDSGGDEILLEHRSRSRRGFALGAVLAAEWIATRKGFHPFDAVLEDLLKT